MPFGLQWIVDKITFPSPPSSYSLTSHPELFFVKSPKGREPGVPCMLYAIPQGAPVLLVHAHSNGCDIGDMRQTLQSISESLRVHVMSFEFPGYGLHVGSANMRSIDDAAFAVLNFIVNDLRVNLGQVVWYGRSIGSGPALRTVHKISTEMGKQPGGVVLQCGYANFPQVAGHLFGRVAKQLVSPLWPNEAMVKELRCPVLLIHGRNDTMIPIEQSERLWKAVNLKELSNFHTCDCGHNDFNFRRCTLRPIYDFLLGVISSPSFPATNFSIELDQSTQTFVHHIGPLRSKIPVYSFRRTELEEWMRRLQQRSAGDVAATNLTPGRRVVVHGLTDTPEFNGKGGYLLDQDSDQKSWTVQLTSGEKLSLRPENLELARPPGSAPGAGDPSRPPLSSGQWVSWEGKQGLLLDFDQAKGKWRVMVEGETLTLEPEELQKQQGKSAGAPPPAAAASGKGKEGKERQPPPIPDFTEMPPVDSVNAALLDLECMVRCTALRVDAFLERLQASLDRVEGLESKSLSEVVGFVEAEFWLCDPLLCLWEEAVPSDGDRTRFRLGPFSVDSTGKTAYDPQLGAGTAKGAFRVPLWLFQPSPAHFRCLAEWSLLHSERLRRSLPGGAAAKGGSACCCVPTASGLRRSAGRSKSKKGRRQETAAHPTRGVLASSLAAHFVNWVDKSEEVKALFGRFLSLHRSPQEAFKALAVAEATEEDPPREPQGFLERANSHLGGSFLERANSSLVVSLSGGNVMANVMPTANIHKQASRECTPRLLPRPPWPRSDFSAAGRAFLHEGVGGESLLVEGDLALPEDAMQGLVNSSDPLGDKPPDWLAANLLLHYERLARESGTAAGDASVPSPEAGGDPMAPELIKAGLALNKAVKLFTAARQKEQRDGREGPPRRGEVESNPPAAAVAG